MYLLSEYCQSEDDAIVDFASNVADVFGQMDTAPNDSEHVENQTFYSTIV